MTKTVCWVLCICLVLVNLAAFLMFGVDKSRAKRGAWRISERTLLTVSACFGGTGAFIGMKVFHHKTQHLRFQVLVPLFMVAQWALIGFAVYRLLRR